MNIAECLEGLAGIAAAQAQDPEGARRAARLFGAAEALRETAGASRSPFLLTHSERAATRVAIMLGEEAPAAWAEGRAMSLEQATAYALKNHTHE